MATPRIRIPFLTPGTDSRTPQADSQQHAQQVGDSDPLLGHTTSAPDPGTVRPRVGAPPVGQSGRANFAGLPQPDEFNPELIGPRGLRLLDQMYREDAHVRRLVLAAWSPIVAGTWHLEPFGGDNATDKDRQVADDVWWMLTEWMSPNFTQHLHELGPLLLRSGFVPFEQLWQSVRRNGKTLLGPRKLDVRLPRSVWQWWQDDFGDLTWIGQILPNKACVTIDAANLVYYRLGAEGDNWTGTSLLRHCFKHWFMKDRLERIDVIGQERKAVGVPVIYHSEGIPAATLDEVEQAVANMHMSESAYLMLPGRKMDAPANPNVGAANEWLVDVIQFDSSSGDGINASIDRHQQAIAASFLTDFLELGHHQVGARATAEVQEDPFLTAVRGALLPPVLPPLHALIRRIVDVNWGPVDGYPQLKLTLNDEASLSEIAAYVVPLVQADAMQVDPDLEDWLRERANMPAANPEFRALRVKAQQAGLESAANLAEQGELPDAEPPSGNQPPQSAQAQTAQGAENTNPVRGAVQNHAQQASGQNPGPNGQKDGQKDGNDTTKTTGKKSLDAPPPPPNLRVSTSPEDAKPEHECGTCKMFDLDTGSCWGYGSFPVDDAWVCDSWTLSPDWQAQDAAADAEDSDGPDDDDPDDDAANPKEPVAGRTQLDQGRPTVAVDFDGVIHGEHDAPDTGPLPGAADGLAKLATRYRLVVFTARTDLHAVRAWLAAHGLGEYAASVTNIKPPAVAYIDDHAEKFTSWPDVERALLDTAAVEPTARWFDQLLSQHRLREAFDGCRDHIQAAVGPTVQLAARKLAHQAANSTPISSLTTPPNSLVDALTTHYSDLYRLGAQTVHDELAKQRQALGTQLDSPDPHAVATGLVATRLRRARHRGEHSARNIVAKINETLGRKAITNLQPASDLQDAAEKAGASALRMEALANATSMVNDGRNDAAQQSSDVVGAYYASVMDERTCAACTAADTGDMLSPDAAVQLGPPNPDCAGSERCRCALVWVLADDPAALGAIITS